MPLLLADSLFKLCLDKLFSCITCSTGFSRQRSGISGFQTSSQARRSETSNVVKTLQDLLLFNEMHVDAHVNDEQVDLLAGEGGSHLLPPPSAHLLSVLLNNQVLRNNLHQSDNDDVGP